MTEVTVGNVQDTDTDEIGAEDEATSLLEAAVVIVVPSCCSLTIVRTILTRSSSERSATRWLASMDWEDPEGELSGSDVAGRVGRPPRPQLPVP